MLAIETTAASVADIHGGPRLVSAHRSLMDAARHVDAGATGDAQRSLGDAAYWLGAEARNSVGRRRDLIHTLAGRVQAHRDQIAGAQMDAAIRSSRQPVMTLGAITDAERQMGG